ncbi:hypothetical protein V1511DRAFT_487774 [Dipodascopsis uninucleata]
MSLSLTQKSENISHLKKRYFTEIEQEEDCKRRKAIQSDNTKSNNNNIDFSSNDTNIYDERYVSQQLHRESYDENIRNAKLLSRAVGATRPQEDSGAETNTPSDLLGFLKTEKPSRFAAIHADCAQCYKMKLTTGLPTNCRSHHISSDLSRDLLVDVQIEPRELEPFNQNFLCRRRPGSSEKTVETDEDVQMIFEFESAENSISHPDRFSKDLCKDRCICFQKHPMFVYDITNCIVDDCKVHGTTDRAEGQDASSQVQNIGTSTPVRNRVSSIFNTSLRKSISSDVPDAEDISLEADDSLNDEDFEDPIDPLGIYGWDLDISNGSEDTVMDRLQTLLGGDAYREVLNETLSQRIFQQSSRNKFSLRD